MINLWSALGTSGRVRFARLRAFAWALVGAVSFPLGWANSVVLVWIASVYANVASEIAAGEAADDDAVISEIRALRRPRPARVPCRSARPAHPRASRIRSR